MSSAETNDFINLSGRYINARAPPQTNTTDHLALLKPIISG